MKNLINNLTDIREKSVLIIETQDWHAETIPGYAKYFLDLGYNVDIFMTPKNVVEYPLCRCPNVARIFIGTLKQLKSFLDSDFITKYDFVFFNSISYKCAKHIPKMFNMLKMPKYGLFGVVHEAISRACDKFPELHNMIKSGRIFVLGDVNGVKRMNPHYFGNVNISPKHKKVIFAAVGAVKSPKIITSAIHQIIDAGIKDFQVVVIGTGTIELSDDISKYVRICGRLKFPDMFNEIENADFLLGLLDINNPSHQSYLKGQVSGSLQLSLGFAKPLILNEVFATNYGLDNKNCIIYSGNDLGDAMIRAYKMTAYAYDKMQQALIATASNIYQKSLQNLKTSISNAINHTTRIPIVFGFDDNYAVPASIAIQSLLDSASPDTQYDIIVFYDKLKNKTKRKFTQKYHIRWIKVKRNLLKKAPTGWSGIATYYRLLLADLLPEYNRVIWSDSDVLFKSDLADIYKINMHNADWAGIIAERQDEKNGVHQHFPENTKPFIFMPGFMIANTLQWRNKNMLNKFLNIIQTYGPQLKMFDLDVLNLAADKICAIPFEYCVLEEIFNHTDITNASEYPWLANSYGHDALVHAHKNPKIIHYAGPSVKIWKRPLNEITPEYLQYLMTSPMIDAEFWFPGTFRKIHAFLLWLVIKLMPIKSVRYMLKDKRKRLVCEEIK